MSEGNEVKGKDIINEFIESVQEGNEHIIDITRKILEDGKEKVTFAMQKRVLQPEQPKPLIRSESPKRAHTFHSVDSFVAYLAKEKTDHTVVLADVENDTITAVLDETAKNGFETIQFKPQTHPLFAPWEDCVIDEKTEIKDFAIFLQQNKKSILFPDAKDLTMFFSQVRASQKITMHKGVGQNSINGLVCEVNIMGSKSENQEVELPETIILNMPIYIDTPEQEIEVDIILGTNNTDIYVQCSSSDLDLKRVKSFEDMITKVSEIDGIIVGFGAYGTQSWSYLR